jgi:hypothetical protein
METTMKKTGALCAVGMISMLTAACAAETTREGEAGEANVQSATEDYTFCLFPQAPVVTKALYVPGGLGGWGGTQATSSSTYGNACTSDFIIETTGTKDFTWAALELSADAVSDSAMTTSSLACALSTITVDAWGRIDSSCTTSETGVCSKWVSLGSNAANGIWSSGATGGLQFPPMCAVHASLPSVFDGPYSALRLGARASKTVFVNGTATKVSLPVNARIGFQQIN